MAGTIADEQPMLQQQRLRGKGAHAACASEFHTVDQQVDSETDDVAHQDERFIRPPVPA
jgi:hypothetical protein